jgi:hypothetical protein
MSGEQKLPGCRYLMEGLSSSLPVLQDITHCISFLPGGAHPLAEA